MPDAHPALDAFATVFALTATALPVAWGASSAAVIWDGYRPDVEESGAVEEYDTDWASFRKDEVADIQNGDTFTAPRIFGATAQMYRVVRVRRKDPQYFHVAVD